MLAHSHRVRFRMTSDHLLPFPLGHQVLFEAKRLHDSCYDSVGKFL